MFVIIKALAKSFSSAESAKKVVSMKAFGKFENTTDALAAAATMVESKVGKSLKTFLKKHVKDETLAIADSKLGVAIKEKLGIKGIPLRFFFIKIRNYKVIRNSWHYRYSI